MSDLYECFKVDFKEFIAELDCRATPIKLVRHTPSPNTINPTTLEPEARTTSEIDLVAVSAPFNGPIVDGQTILSGDIRVLMDDQNEPFQDDNVLIDGNNYSIINLRSFNPGGVQIGWELQVRR